MKTAYLLFCIFFLCACLGETPIPSLSDIRNGAEDGLVAVYEDLPSSGFYFSGSEELMVGRIEQEATGESKSFDSVSRGQKKLIGAYEIMLYDIVFSSAEDRYYAMFSVYSEHTGETKERMIATNSSEKEKLIVFSNGGTVRISPSRMIPGYTSFSAETGGGSALLYRALYRFNVSEIAGRDFTLNLKCNGKYSDPGSVDIYVVEDFGDFPASRPEEAQDTSDLWSLTESGKKVASVIPSPGNWLRVSVPYSSIASKITDEKVSFMLKLTDEEKNAYYSFSSYEYALANKERRPFLSR